MRFPFISTKYIFEEIRSLLKSYNVQGLINDDDCRAYSFSAARLIGCGNYEPDELFIRIENYKAFIPKDFYNVNSVFYSGLNEKYETKSPMFPSDVETRKLINTETNIRVANENYTYVLKVPPFLIKTNFQKGWVLFSYNRLNSDEFGNIMVQDEENVLQAIKYYIISNILMEKMLLGEIKESVWAMFDSKWNDHSKYARDILKFPDHSETDKLVKQKDNRYAHVKVFR